MYSKKPEPKRRHANQQMHLYEMKHSSAEGIQELHPSIFRVPNGSRASSILIFKVKVQLTVLFTGI